MLEEKKYVGSKKVKNIYANFSVANTHKPINYKTNCLEKNLNDAIVPLKIKNAVVLQSIQKHRLQNS